MNFFDFVNFTNPYVDSETGVLKNKFGIDDANDLRIKEFQFSTLGLRELDQNPINGKFDLDHICSIHHHLFKDIYDWAGEPRIINSQKPEFDVLAGRSVKYSDCPDIKGDFARTSERMKNIPWSTLSENDKVKHFSNNFAELWRIHPFWDGNTRTTTQFCSDLANKMGIPLDNKLFRENPKYLRNALTAANAKFPDLGDVSKPEYLYNMVGDAMQRGRKINRQSQEQSNTPYQKQDAQSKDIINRLHTINNYAHDLKQAQSNHDTKKAQELNRSLQQAVTALERDHGVGLRQAQEKARNLAQRAARGCKQSEYTDLKKEPKKDEKQFEKESKNKDKGIEFGW